MTFDFSEPDTGDTAKQRQHLRDLESRSEAAAVHELMSVKPTADALQRVDARAREFIATIRSQQASADFAAILLQQFALNTSHGVALMQLAEALPRTRDAIGANTLIADKLGSIDWQSLRAQLPRDSHWIERQALRGLGLLSRAFAHPEHSERHVLRALGRAALRQGINRLSGKYLLGESLNSALINSKPFAKQGYSFSYDMLGEAAITAETSDRLFASYLAAASLLKAQPRTSATRNAISVKLSALYPRFEERQRASAVPVLVARVKELALLARDAQMDLTIDAEEAERLEITVDVFERLRADVQLKGWPGLGLAVQAYQRRAPAVINFLVELSRANRERINVRLVKGAYWDGEIKRAQRLGLSDYPIFTRKSHTDVSYLACAQTLFSHHDSLIPQFATHNAHTAAAVIELAQQHQVTGFEFQRLHGMGESLHDELLKSGFHSRIYAPVGARAELLPYLVRRLLENGASSSFVHKLFDVKIDSELLVRDPFGLATAEAGVAQPRVVANQSWPTASGFDIANRNTLSKFADQLREAPSGLVAAPIINGIALLGEGHPIINPAALTETVGRVIEASDTHVSQALISARAEFASWSAVAASDRAAILRRAADHLEAESLTFIRLAVLEAGKTAEDAIAEVREAVDFCRYYADQLLQPTMQSRHSLGVVACISPWNFPLAIFLGQIVGALAAGNAVIAKPAEQTPLIAMFATKLLHDAGIPTNALHLLPGDGSVGANLVARPGIDAVCFTGSSAAARAITRSLAATARATTPLIAETGGVNAMIVDSTALPEQVVLDVITSAFQSAGQRCSALRLLCVQEDIADHLIGLLKGAMQLLRIGDPRDLATDIGPVVDHDARRMIQDYLLNKTRILAQSPLDETTAANGWYVAPTLLEVNRVSDVAQEIFGPVLHVLRYKSGKHLHVINAINALGYGLTLGIHSRSQRRVQQIISKANVGNIYLNRNQIGAVVGQQPFGGHGLSGTGPKAGGPNYLLRLSRNDHNMTSVGNVLFSDAPTPYDIETIAKRARKVQRHWDDTPNRDAILRRGFESIGVKLSTRSNAAQSIDSVQTNAAIAPGIALPAIAGESNVLQLRGRGVLLAAGTIRQDIDYIYQLLSIVLATGNAVILIVNEQIAPSIKKIVAGFVNAGVPGELIQICENAGGTVPSTWLKEADIDGAVFDGTRNSKLAIAGMLAAREGAILPLLSVSDDVYRFYAEQTVTVNTAAAGGDTQLLESAGGF